MKIEVIDKKLERLNKDATIQNFFAQANARYILLNTAEEKDNFPPYTIQDDHLNLLALQYLNLGCSYAEKKAFSDAAIPLEKGASLLEVVHASKTNRSLTSNYYGLIAALSYYVAFEYSKAFILITKFEATTPIASLLRQFLQRNFNELSSKLYPILVGDEYTDVVVAEDNQESGNQRIYEFTIAKALDAFIQYYRTGNVEILENAKTLLRNLKEIAELEEDVGVWWIVRLLLLISEGFNEASIWNVLPKYFDTTDDQVLGYIRSLVYMRPRGHYELFVSQREALSKVLSNDLGCVVSIPTSSGKTRLAELAILHSIKNNAQGKILYVAPFRSLAFEVENSLEKVFQHSGIRISHLYGGSLYSKLDQMSVEDAHVIIATPEKAKAILRANREAIGEISLAILDEGHLLGGDKRLIMNEIFYEELRYHVEKNGGRFLLLSAVLPNADDLSNWLTQSKDTVFKNNWRPSEERLGILEWRNNTASLNWESQDSERSSFNPRFILADEVKRYKYRGVEKIKYFPGNKNEAIAATAYKLRNFGPLLIFVGAKGSVFVMARAYLGVMGANAAEHVWKSPQDWRAFELACIETYGPNNSWLDFAKKGILCHNSALHADVRLPLERLMREERPLAIISTSTLGQGVNLGVSTVIFSTLYQAGEKIKARDFWNIAGRAGRAFVDHEGKILVAVDTNGTTPIRRRNMFKEVQVNYFNKNKIDRAQSGILSLVIALKEFAERSGTDFDLLLQLIAENKIGEIGDKAVVIDDILDWIDDTLLSLSLLHNPKGIVDVSWVEDFFVKSLAAIQAEVSDKISTGQVIAFLKSRTLGIANKVGNDRSKWDSIVQSGIPLTSDLQLEQKIDDLIEAVDDYLLLDEGINEKIALLKSMEKIIKNIPVLNEKGNYLEYPKINKIRKNWLKATAISDILSIPDGASVITGVYSFSLPWVLNGIAKKMRQRDCDVQGEVVEELSLLVEAGLPSLIKVKIYQSGIRSRSAANELGDLLDNSFAESSLSAYRKEFIKNADGYMPFVSDITKEWLEMLQRYSTKNISKITRIAPFTFPDVHMETRTLLAKQINGRKYLLSPDLSFRYEGWGDIYFDDVADVPGISFVYNEITHHWDMINSDPYIIIEETE